MIQQMHSYTNTQEEYLNLHLQTFANKDMGI